MALPRETSTLSDSTDEIREEVISTSEALSIDLTEEKIKEILGRRVEDAEAWWEKKLELKEKRKENEQRWLNNNLEVSGKDNLYDFQVPYKDNRIFLSVETLVSNTVAKMPLPEVIEAQDTDASRELASNYGKVLYRKAEDLWMKPKLQMVGRHLLMGYRVGVIKVSWDFNAGRVVDGEPVGDVAVNFVRPHRIVVAERAEDPDDVPLIAESMRATVEELTHRFPNKKKELLDAVGANTGTKVNMGSEIGYREIWFSYLDKEGVKREGVCWRYGKDLILDYGINPYFNYDEGSNYFDRPQKPYVFFNYLRTGKYVYDDTSLTEQSAVLQDVLEKRGRQIVESADQASGTKIFNTMQIDAAAAEKYTGDPRDNILVKGDVRTAFKREAPEILPKYVLEDKFDARREIDNMFGTHAPLRGEKTESPTLGQEVLSQRSDLGRQVTLSESIEKGAKQVYGHMTQQFKVFGDFEHWVRYTGADTGRTTFIQFSNDKIEDGIEIRVQAGSMKADDKLTDRTEAVELAKTGKIIDPLTFAEKWHLPQPRKFAKRAFHFLFMPDRYYSEDLEGGEGGGDAEAMQTIQRINAGDNVPPKENPSKEYVAYYGQFVKSPAFKQLNPEVQRLHIEHIRGTAQSAKGGLREEGQEQQPNLLDRAKGLFGR
jgi:hypothetical protein